jgi:hypothetical protein
MLLMTNHHSQRSHQSRPRVLCAMHADRPHNARASASQSMDATLKRLQGLV